MGVSIDLYKVNYNKFKTELMARFNKITDEKLLKNIIKEFATFVDNGKNFIILHNEYYEEGICTWNMYDMIEDVFKLKDDPKYDTYNKKTKKINSVQDVFYDIAKEITSYKESYEAYEHLGLDSTEDEDIDKETYLEL